MGDREGPEGLYVAVLSRWVALVARHPWVTLACVAALTAGSAYVTASRFAMNSDTGDLIRQDAPFRERYEAFQDAFPQLEDTILVVVTAADLDRSSDAAERLAAALRGRPDVFRSIHAPTLDPFFRSRALYYLEPEVLEDRVDALAGAQPALAVLARDPSVRGLAGLLRDALERGAPGDWPEQTGVLADRLARAAEGLLAGEPSPVSWTDALGAGEEFETFHLIVVQGVPDFAASSASSPAIDTLRAEARALGLGPDSDVRVRLTGMVPLEHEELASAQRSVELAGSVSLVLLTLILGFGLRSLRLIVAALVSLGVGLCWTSAFALLAVGAFNPISVTFAVLFVGLGIDIAIHFGLRYREELGGGRGPAHALQGATRGVGGAVSLCAVTSAVGFLSFVPTDYRGLADLGVIAGGGMACALLASFTALPALLAGLGGGGRVRRGDAAPLARRVAPLVQRHARPIVLVSLGLAVVAAGFAHDVRFDFSTLGLKDPRSEAMQTLRFLQSRDVATDYALSVLAEPDEAGTLARRLRGLDSVATVRTPEDEVPGAQSEKAALLEDARLLLGPALHPAERLAPPDAAERLASVRALRRAIAASAERQPAALADELRRLGDALDALLARPDPAAELARWESLVTRFLDARLAWLRDALDAGPFAFADLPETSRERLVAPDGRRRLVVIPRHDLSDFDTLRAFIDEVTAVAPHATGRPVVEAGIGEIVVRAFRNALGIAVLCILLTLALVLRRARDAVLVLVPLVVAALFTLATGVLAGLPFNMANVIVLPLLLGLGVDNGVHVLLRFRQGGSFASVMASTTPRAVVLSSLTTLGAFGALSLSSHLGIRSMGILLSVGMLYLLLGTLVVLPALLAWVGGTGTASGGPGGGSAARPLPPAAASRGALVAGWSALAASPRLALWLRYLGLFVAIASAERVALALWLGRRNPEAAGAWLRALVEGAADDVVTGVAVGLPFLVALAAGPRRPRAAAVLSTVCTALWLFLALASLFFFGQFETRFNRLVVEYLAYPREAFGFLLETYRVVLGLVPVAVVALALEAWLAPARRRALAAPRSARARRRELALAGVLAAAVWGAWSAPGAGGFADDGRVAEHLARNPLQALGRAIAADASHWRLPSLPGGRALSLARASLPASEGPFVGPALERRVSGAPAATRPDLVLVIEESLGMRQALARDASGEPLAPNLLGLSERGLFFPHVYATGTRTARGLEALLTSFPPLLGPPVVRRPEGRGLHSLASVLSRAGYETAFLYPGHARFDDLGPFCRSVGFDRVFDLRDFAEPGFRTVWGAADEHLFDEALRRLDARGPDDPPLFLAMLTVSNHPPHRLPPGAHVRLPGATDAERATAYADRALGDFVRRAAARPWFADTVLGVVADHGADSRGPEAIPLASYRVPFAVLAPGRVAPGVDPVIGSSVDVGPTLLGVLGIPYESPFFGVDLRRVPPGAGRALLSHFEALGRLDRDGLVVLREGRPAVRYPLEDPAGRLGPPVPAGAEDAARALGVFQTAHRLLYTGGYRPSP